MSGISTNSKYAILDASRGINLDTFPTMTALAEQAMRSAMWEMSPEEHAAWAERMVAMVREHRDLSADAPALKLWCSGCNKPTTWALTTEVWQANYREKCPACGGEITMAQEIAAGAKEEDGKC